MAFTFTIQLSGITAGQAVDSFCSLYGYKTLVNGLPNPESRADFAQRMAASLLRSAYLSGVAKITRDTTADSVTAS